MIDMTQGVVIQKEEYLCQLCFDLGGYYFYQRELGKAAAMFERVVALLPKVRLVCLQGRVQQRDKLA